MGQANICMKYQSTPTTPENDPDQPYSYAQCKVSKESTQVYVCHKHATCSICFENRKLKKKKKKKKKKNRINWY